LRAEVTRAWEATAAAEATYVALVLAIETSAQEVAVARDSVIARVKDVEDRATLTEKEARERVSGVEVESVATLPSTREGTESLVRKITPA
jgi:hypothetical protein